MSRGDVTLIAQPQALVGEAVRMDGDDVVWDGAWVGAGAGALFCVALRN